MAGRTLAGKWVTSPRSTKKVTPQTRTITDQLVFFLPSPSYLRKCYLINCTPHFYLLEDLLFTDLWRNSSHRFHHQCVACLARAKYFDFIPVLGFQSNDSCRDVWQIVSFIINAFPSTWPNYSLYGAFCFSDKRCEAMFDKFREMRHINRRWIDQNETVYNYFWSWLPKYRQVPGCLTNFETSGDT